METVSNPDATQVLSERRLPEPLAVLELLKPVTWFPPMWAFLCGAVSSGAGLLANPFLVLVGILLSGPLVCAMSQAINDWHDREVDAINEPHRPIPSGRVPGRWGLYVAGIWTVLSLIVAQALGFWVFVATIVGLFLAWAYSAPPFRFKLNGWIGNGVVAICYEGLAWFTGAAVLLGAIPSYEIVVVAALYSFGAHGIMTLNDFKSIAGDKLQGVFTLPVQLGADRAARVASVMMALPQLVVIGLLVHWGLVYHAAAVSVLTLLQVASMVKYLLNRQELLAEPKRNAALYNMTGVGFYVIGMMITAAGIGSLVGGVG